MKLAEIDLAKPLGIQTIHYSVAIRESYAYRLLCNGKVVDALGCAGESAHPTCRRCQALDVPKKAEAAGREVGEMLGYEGREGGWIYKQGRPVCHGWGAFANRYLASFAAEGYVVPVIGQDRIKRFQVVVSPAPTEAELALAHRPIEVTL
jgi:hypothetical protein